MGKFLAFAVGLCLLIIVLSALTSAFYALVQILAIVGGIIGLLVWGINAVSKRDAPSL
jgi:hypothetical protein